MTTVAFVTNIIPVYRYPVFAAVSAAGDLDIQIFVTVPLSQSCPEAVANLSIRYSSSWNAPRTTKHPVSGASQTEPLSIPLRLAKDLRDIRPEIIVAGELGLRTLICWCVSKCLGATFVISSEEIHSSATGRSRLQKILRHFLIRRADALLAWGDPARRYLLNFGVDPARIFNCTQAIDNEFWMRQARVLDRAVERQRLQLQGTVFLLVGRALRRKGFQNFIEAWSRLPAELHKEVTAVIVGDGDYLGELKIRASRHDLCNIKFVGAKSPSELARYYAAGDIFVLPSLEDVWGLVANEAMCFGLPILASQYAGAAQSLIADSSLGIVFNPADIDEFASRLRSWARSPPGRTLRQSHFALREITFDRSSSAIRQMIAHVTTARVSRAA